MLAVWLPNALDLNLSVYSRHFNNLSASDIFNKNFEGTKPTEVTKQCFPIILKRTRRTRKFFTVGYAEYTLVVCRWFRTIHQVNTLFQALHTADLTYPYHCCAFSHPAAHRPEEYANYQVQSSHPSRAQCTIGPQNRDKKIHKLSVELQAN